MLEDPPAVRDATTTSSARQLAGGMLALVGLTYGLIVLGALVRAHEAGLACPDWPLCFGELVPEMDLRVGFEWTHRLVAGTVGLLFAAFAVAVLRRPETPRSTRRALAVAAVLLVVQIGFGGLTVLLKLASWTVTAHLLIGNTFAATLLLIGVSLYELGAPTPPRPPLRVAGRAIVVLAAFLLFAQMLLGGMVSSQYAGLACPEWPACNGGHWFPSWSGPVGLHLLHRTNGYALFAVLVAAALACRGAPRLGGLTLLAAALGTCQVVVGIANVVLGIPVEVTGLHSALATALVLTLTLSMREVFLREVQAT